MPICARAVEAHIVMWMLLMVACQSPLTRWRAVWFPEEGSTVQQGLHASVHPCMHACPRIQSMQPSSRRRGAHVRQHHVEGHVWLADVVVHNLDHDVRDILPGSEEQVALQSLQG